MLVGDAAGDSIIPTTHHTNPMRSITIKLHKLLETVKSAWGRQGRSGACVDSPPADEAIPRERMFIGGVNAAGEERYQLLEAIVDLSGSTRISIDQMSLER